MTEVEANGGVLLSRVLGSYAVLRGNRNLQLLFGGSLSRTLTLFSISLALVLVTLMV